MCRLNDWQHARAELIWPYKQELQSYRGTWILIWLLLHVSCMKASSTPQYLLKWEIACRDCSQSLLLGSNRGSCVHCGSCCWFTYKLILSRPEPLIRLTFSFVSWEERELQTLQVWLQLTRIRWSSGASWNNTKQPVCMWGHWTN